MKSTNCSFVMSLAETVIGVEANYVSTRDFCKDYLLDAGKPDFVVTISEEKIRKECRLSKKPGVHSDAYFETLALYREIAQKLIWKDVLLIHGSVVAVDGVGYLFAAKSGIGKSTHSRLWRRYFGNRAVMINDDKPLLRVTRSEIVAYGTPWNGKHRLSTNTSAPLKAICFLNRCADNRVVSVDTDDVLPLLLQQCYLPDTPSAMMQTLFLLNKLINNIRFYRIFCNMDISAAKTVYEAIKHGENL